MGKVHYSLTWVYMLNAKTTTFLILYRHIITFFTKQKKFRIQRLVRGVHFDTLKLKRLEKPFKVPKKFIRQICLRKSQQYCRNKTQIDCLYHKWYIVRIDSLYHTWHIVRISLFTDLPTRILTSVKKELEGKDGNNYSKRKTNFGIKKPIIFGN